MRVVLASSSAVKIRAVQRAFGPGVEVVPVSVPSGVPEQPVEEETMQGARNRVRGARAKQPGADHYVSIESGLFKVGESWVDRAAVVVENTDGTEHRIVFTEGVVFPTECVEEAERRGFDTWTAGKVLQERGIVGDHADPHKDLSGRSRAEYIDEALGTMVRALGVGAGS